LLAVTHQVGCSSPPAEEVGVVRVAITSVPADVRCIRLTATGSRTVSRLFDVAPNMSSVLLMSGVPTGMVQFSGDAFADACGAVSAVSVPTWSSDPVGTQVSSGALADVTLVMHHNGRAQVSVDFQDDGGASCGQTGMGCMFLAGGTSTCCAGLACGFDNLCNPSTCTDGVQNGTESDTDCGGLSCSPCPNLSLCQEDSDCASGICLSRLCQAMRCSPPGTSCNPFIGQPCCGNFTCVGMTAIDRPGTCQLLPTCSDGVRNGLETDVDCGGPTCAACSDNLACQVASDCTSGACVSGVCQQPTCSDGMRNGLETDVDCGGPSCPGCPDGRQCGQGTDCANGVCVGAICQTPICSGPGGFCNPPIGEICCAGLVCFGATRDEPGICQSPPCLPQGSLCTPGNPAGPCCAGSTCAGTVAAGVFLCQ
jgi:hypothetical protein